MSENSVHLIDVTVTKKFETLVLGDKLSEEFGTPVSIHIDENSYTIEFIDGGNMTFSVLDDSHLTTSVWFIGLARDYPTILSVDICSINEDVMPTIIKILAECTHLQELSIDSQRVGDVLRSNRDLRKFTLVPPDETASIRDLCEAIIEHPTLQVLACDRTFSTNEILDIIRRNRVLREIDCRLRNPYPWQRRPICDAVSENWMLREIITHESDKLDIELKWLCQTQSWSYQCPILRKHCMAFLPLQLPSYEVLWILDWIPPFSKRYSYAGDQEFDPHHVRKLRLIERLKRSYERTIA